MGLKSFNPYTASRRFITVVEKSHITKQQPEKALLEPKKRSGGRNNQGEVVIWHRGGGHKKQYRKVDFRRDKIGVPAKVAAIEYDPNRSANLALLHYADGEKRYIIHPIQLEVGATVSTGEGADILPRNALQFKHLPAGTMVHNIELYPGRGGQVVRSAGSSAQLLSKEGEIALVKLPSGEVRKFSVDCMATIGQVGNLDHENETYGKAGRTRWRGIRDRKSTRLNSSHVSISYAVFSLKKKNRCQSTNTHIATSNPTFAIQQSSQTNTNSWKSCIPP